MGSKRRKRVFRLVRTIGGLVLCFCTGVLLELVINSFHPKKTLVYTEDQFLVEKVYDDECRLANNVDQIKLFVYPELWEQATHEDKQEAVIKLVACEARYIGVPFKINVLFIGNMPYDTKASYLHNKKDIYINNVALADCTGSDAMIYVLHEMRHVYQHCLIDLYVTLDEKQRNLIVFEGVDTWMNDINNYVKEPYEVYYSQALESDARSSAIKESGVYFIEVRDLCEDN